MAVLSLTLPGIKKHNKMGKRIFTTLLFFFALVQGRWSVYLHGGGIVGPEKLAPGEMDFEFTGTDSVTIHNYHTGLTSGRKIIKWKRTSFGHLLFAYKENAVENYYWLQYLHSQDTLHLIFTTSPLLGKGGEIFSSSMMRIKL
jgi:hypothetical protein